MEQVLLDFKKYMEEVVIPEIVEVIYQRQIAAAKSRKVILR